MQRCPPLQHESITASEQFITESQISWSIIECTYACLDGTNRYVDPGAEAPIEPLRDTFHRS